MKRSSIDWWSEPVDLLPSQVSRSNPSNYSPEVRLVWAVLEAAVQSVVHRRVVRDRREHREFVEACKWMLDDQRDWPFAFANICDLLGLDTSAIRRALSLEELLLDEIGSADRWEAGFAARAQPGATRNGARPRGEVFTSRQCPSFFIAGAPADASENSSGASFTAHFFDDPDDIENGART